CIIQMEVEVQGALGAGSPLLVVLVDGLRFDYLDDMHDLPGFRQLVEDGVKVDHPRDSSVSCATESLNCDRHQMTGNFMWDEVSDKEFLIATNADSRLPLWWNGSEPIWVTAEKKGKNVHMYYWSGCEVEILGVRPSFCEEYVYNPSLKNFTDSIEKALNALQSGKAEMAAVYYEKIDVEGHHFGPDSHQLKMALRELDTAIQTLNKKIKDMDMGDKLNVMMFSDHGMTPIKWMERVIELDKHINMSDLVKMMDRGAVVSVWPKHNKHQENQAKLPYWKNGTGVASGWQNGWHGYDNDCMDMRAFFLAKGPDFKKGAQAPPIQLVDIYNLMCRTLGVDPRPNNGSWSRVENMLSGGGEQPRPVLLWSLLAALMLVLLAGWWQ
ncbi:hypothetical protein NHX12_011787, partial [Muraenolepis orangiensis]